MTLAGLYTTLLLVLTIPATQRWTAGILGSALHQALGWNITIGRVQLGFMTRIILDNVVLHDQQGQQMLSVSRMATKIDLLPLILDRKISISNAQLFGANATLYQDSPEDKPNFQFIIDTFSSGRKKKTGIDLYIGSLLIRHTSVKWDRRWEEETPRRINPSHLELKHIALTANLDALQNDSLNVQVKRLSVSDKSGLRLLNMKFRAEAGTHGARLEDFDLQLPGSSVTIPEITAAWDGLPEGDMKQWLKSVTWDAGIHVGLVLADLSFLEPRLESSPLILSLATSAHGEDGNIRIPDISLTDRQGYLSLESQAEIHDLSGSPSATLVVSKLYARQELQQEITRITHGECREISPILTRLGSLELSGKCRYTRSEASSRLTISTPHGSLDLDGIIRERNEFDIKVETPSLQLGKILSDNNNYFLGEVSVKGDINGMLKNSRGLPQISADITLPLLTLQGYHYQGVRASGHYDTESGSLTMEAGGVNGSMTLDVAADGLKKGMTPHINANATLSKVCLDRLNITRKYPDMNLSANIAADIAGRSVDDCNGSLFIEGLELQHNDGSEPMAPVSLSVTQQVDNLSQRMVSVESDFLQCKVSGNFTINSLRNKGQEFLSMHLRNLFRSPSALHAGDSCRMELQATLRDTSLIERFTGKDIYIPQDLAIHGSVSQEEGLMSLTVEAPEVKYGREHFLGSSIEMNASRRNIDTRIRTTRKTKKSKLQMALRSTAADNKVRTTLDWDNKSTPAQTGNVDVSCTLEKDADGQTSVKAWLAPSHITIADTLWQIHPALIAWNGKAADISGFRVSNPDGRSIEANGRLSAQPTDTISVSLNRINLEYIMDMINFHSVEFMGETSGKVYASSVLGTPLMDAYLHVSRFRFNYGLLGNLDAHASWGYKPSSLGIEATILDPSTALTTTIDGEINLAGKGGLDLMIGARGFNLEFINFWTKGIIEDIMGRASGMCRLYGPFNALDLNGDLRLEGVNVTVPVIGTSFSLGNNSIHVRPGVFSLPNATVRDREYERQKNTDSGHKGVLNATLNHVHFDRMQYSVILDMDNVLCYNKPEIDDDGFAAVFYASGNARLKGGPGSLTVDVNASPERGSQFTYSVYSPGSVSKNSFISYEKLSSGGRRDSSLTSLESDGSESRIHIGSDLFLNFSFLMNDNCPIRLLMDKRTGDNIELRGTGRITANYHNKSGIRLYGTYRTTGGSYKLSVQDILRREFAFLPDGTITFGGNPMLANLNLQASYTIQNVSLDDLASSSLGLHKTRVDCLLKLTGQTRNPIVSFDFDMPNASAAERQMVNVMVNTEEERNMQVMYLLGIGRFYSNSNQYKDGRSQGGVALNSIVSSTLSSQFNQFMSQAVGSRNWSFGANIRTGETGWNDMDVEGMISGRALDDRLLINGNFGYRETYYSQRNFIGDVDLQYLLTRNGSVSLKVYNKTNDRYFVQSSLTTQGLGIQLQKDFDRVWDLFRWIKKKK